ncbi:carbonic anhydrase [Stella humosa]|uniref:carbonic anhydrase n=1 Tax=Stella humosa TaxID=94 RepID=A0A3N1KY61_9PROT|nr:carbonic anhydrase [Stella humosa]ROP83530.1 carbonic anhydrase [Stella humosa]BBK33197.1 carbonic anhydrase [Stella humosa]
MDELLDGYRRFRSEVWPSERARYEQLARRGQRPKTLIVACSDSRVDPQTVFDAAPGELFVVRNVAGLVPPYSPDGVYHGTSAALEFGVRVLKVENIVVLGHAQCGGVAAMVQGAPAEARDFVEPWMSMGRSVPPPPPDVTDPDAILDHYEVEIVRLALANLLTFPWIAEPVAAGQLALHGFRFGIRSGVLSRLGENGLVPVT